MASVPTPIPLTARPEASPRRLSVKRAAEELCVTPGAVSQLLKSLESELGVRLFERVNRGIYLTATGQNYLPPIRNALRQIAEATERIGTSADSGRLTISTTPSFAASWLVPRLKGFQDAHPAVDLQIVTGKALADFSRDGVDVAIRHGLGHYPGLHSERVFALEMVPVAARALAARFDLPAAPADLRRWPLLHDAGRRDWPLWFQAQGIDDAGPPRGAAFDDSNLLMQAALAGQGAALLPLALVAAELAAGRLLRLTDTVWPEAFAYYLVYPKNRHEQPKVAAFRSWILAEASSDTNREAPGVEPWAGNRST